MTGGSVLGIDLSSQMLAVAARRAAASGLTNVAFENADAQTHRFVPASFDVAISSMGVMFFDDPVAAFANIAGALKPGGRILFLVWRTLPEVPWMLGVRTAFDLGRNLPFPPLDVPSPFALGNPERNASLLTAAGLEDVVSTPMNEDIVLGTDLDDAFGFVRSTGMVKGLTEDLTREQQEEGFAALRDYLAGYAAADGVRAPSATWLISARKPA